MIKKSQGGIELMILVGVLLTFFVTFSLVMQYKIESKKNEVQALNFKNVATNIQDEINYATESPDGYYREFDVPLKINDKDFTISHETETDGGTTIYLEENDKKNSYSVRVGTFVGAFRKGKNTIKKANGEVKVNQP